MDRATLRSWHRINALKQDWLGADGDSQPPAATQEEWLLPPASTAFTLGRRTLLNPGSQGGVLSTRLGGEDGELPAWQSGDSACCACLLIPNMRAITGLRRSWRTGMCRCWCGARADGTPGVLPLALQRHESGRFADIAVRQHSSA